MIIVIHSKNGHASKRVSKVRDRFMEKLFDDSAVRFGKVQELGGGAKSWNSVSTGAERFYAERAAEYVLQGSGEMRALRAVRDNPGKFTFSLMHLEELSKMLFHIFPSPMISSVEHRPYINPPDKLVDMTSTTDFLSVKECKERVLDAARGYVAAKWWHSDRGDKRRTLKYWVNRLDKTIKEHYGN